MSRDHPLMVSHSGIRGIVGRSLTGETVRRFAAAFAARLPAGSRVVLARDTRPSGEDFARTAAEELQEAGCAVLDLGVCATPAAKMMVLLLPADGAVILTASHNPAEWNGLKLIRGDGIFLDAGDARQVEAAFHRGDRRRAPGGRLQRVPREEVEDRFLERVLDVVDVGLVRRAGLRAAVDPCNGTGALFTARACSRPWASRPSSSTPSPTAASPTTRSRSPGTWPTSAAPSSTTDATPASPSIPTPTASPSSARTADPSARTSPWPWRCRSSPGGGAAPS